MIEHKHRRHFLSLALGSLATSRLGAAPLPMPMAKSDFSLIYVEDLETKGKDGKDQCRLMRVRVNEGEVGAPVEILILDARDYRQYNQLQTLFDNRYLINHYTGSIIDLKNGIVIRVRGGRFVGFDGNRAMFRKSSGPSDENGLEAFDVYAFDLKECKETKLKDLGRWGLSGLVSPDGKRSLKPRNDTDDLEIQTVDGKLIKLGKEYSFQLTLRLGIPLGSQPNHTPAIWIDNDTILTQIKNGELVLVDVNAKKRKPFAKVEVPAQLEYPPVLFRHVNGQLFYRCDDSNFVIDLEKTKVTLFEDTWWPIGHDFAVQRQDKLGRRTFIRHGKEKIDENVGHQRATCPGHLADVVGAGAKYSEIRIWSAVSGKWTTIPIRVNCIIGWVAN